MRIDDNAKNRIMELIKEKSISEVASIVGCGVSSVSNVIRSNNIVRSKDDITTIRSRVRTNLVKAERRRAIFGLDQKSNLKVFSNKERNSLKYCLKRKGYLFFERGVNIAYFNEDTTRDERYEERGRKLGIQFLQFEKNKQLKFI